MCLPKQSLPKLFCTVGSSFTSRLLSCHSLITVLQYSFSSTSYCHFPSMCTRHSKHTLNHNSAFKKFLPALIVLSAVVFCPAQVVRTLMYFFHERCMVHLLKCFYYFLHFILCPLFSLVTDLLFGFTGAAKSWTHFCSTGNVEISM